MRKNKSISSIIISWIFVIIMLFAIVKLYGIFRSHYFNGFIKAESTLGLSKFIRDSGEKYSESNSYKIESPEFNDATFYKELEVTQNTVYKVTCMVKTQDVVPFAINTDGGANISIIEEPEISKSITGTNDWQKIEMYFNSKHRTNIKIGFRLGGNTGKAKGTAWFSDFKLEKGIEPQDSIWNVGCFILKNLDVDIGGQNYKFTMSTSDIETVKSNMKRFQGSCKSLSDGKMQVKYDVITIDEPIKTISHSDEHGYYIDPYDVNQFIEDTVLEKEYDFIFVAVRMGNDRLEIPVEKWIGLR